MGVTVTPIDSEGLANPDAWHSNGRNRQNLRLDSAVRTSAIAPPVAHRDLVVDCIEKIRLTWSRGAHSTVELAKVLADIRGRLRYGQWAQLWESSRLPFSKRKGEMLVVIGERLDWLDGWSVLYCLALLERETLNRLIEEGSVHPKLTLQEAKELLAKFNGHSNRNKKRRPNVQHRLHLFGDFIRRTLPDWNPAERELAKRELTRLLELIDPGGPASFERALSEGPALMPTQHAIRTTEYENQFLVCVCPPASDTADQRAGASEQENRVNRASSSGTRATSCDFGKSHHRQIAKRKDNHAAECRGAVGKRNAFHAKRTMDRKQGGD